MVGDLSGKYGPLEYQVKTDGSTSVVAQISDPRMPSLRNLAGRGLVLKCGNEAWCATLQRMRHGLFGSNLWLEATMEGQLSQIEIRRLSTRR